MAQVVKMDQHQATVRFRKSEAETEEERAMRPTASSNSFTFNMPPKTRVGSNQTQAQPNSQNPHTTPPTPATNPTPSYALTASKHAPVRPLRQGPAPTPTQHPSRKQNQGHGPESFINICQKTIGGLALSTLKQHDMLSLVNRMLEAKKIKSKMIGFQIIKIKAVH
ncbi:hypothetical protein CROQUDRAFT_96683 [Cronartium quercuum f. sp. fusiforme G11]|uniref:Uncharacterized protein n=1 Tax=Cronartium quercuum f. sp. fusiforme G11 TaxID=708437 RepID=A0A9P6T937_9BASI|nr:hypothetical protein CROQUDRAFT_96683 [Cronartium quercuum f. sp. fusiforme G11]